MNKSKLKKGITAALAAALIAAQAMPVMAYSFTDAQFADTSMTIHSDTDDYGHYKWSAGKKTTFPAWYWVDQYCYYFDRYDNYLKNTTTPDGYTVDELGRWTVNGVPQTNNYGNVVIGTDQLYAGKSDDERWKVMKGLLEELYNTSYMPSHKLSFISRDDTLQIGYTGLTYGADMITHNSSNKEYIYASLSGGWSDSTFAENSPASGSIGIEWEKRLKILLGDHVGQELFNEFRVAAEPLGGPKTVLELDENGNVISYVEYEEFMGEKIPVTKSKQKTIPQSGDGINPNLIDLSKWKNRTTDYGKQFSVSIEGDDWIRKVIISIK